MQLALGLEFIHSHRHVHRDICPRNILIANGGDRLIISDFGLVRTTHGGYQGSQSNGMDTWLAPETILENFSPTNRVTSACDVFSMGCVFYHFVTKGSHPFGGSNGFEMQKKIVDGKSSLESERASI